MTSTGERPARIVVAGHALLRQGLVVLMRRAHPEWTFGEAASFEETRALLAVGATDLLLIDVRIPGMTDDDGSSGDSLRALRKICPEAAVAVLMAAEDRTAILDCRRAGARGYILKSDAADTLVGAAEALLAGDAHVPPVIARAIEEGAGSPTLAEPVRSPAGPTHLTPRQSDVLKLLAEGRSTKDIARRLDLGLGTVKVHLAGIYRALGASNRVEAVDRAGRLNLAR